MVIYFTGTGNSQYLAECTAQALEDEIVCANIWIKEGKPGLFHSDKPYVFVCPTYSWRMPKIFESFIDESGFSGSTECYFIMDCGGNIGNAQKGLQKLCQRKGLHYRGVKEIVMPENYIALFSAPTKEKEKSLLKAAVKETEAAVQFIRQGTCFTEKKVTIVDRLESSVIYWMFYRFIISDKKFYATEKCISCGRCESLCPLNNVRLVSGRPSWNGNCTHCMACICGCPAGCIEYGKHTIGLRRYFLNDSAPNGKQDRRIPGQPVR